MRTREHDARLRRRPRPGRATRPRPRPLGRVARCAWSSSARPPTRSRPRRRCTTAGHEVALVVTQPDRRRGRGSEPSPSPVKAAAEALGLPVRTPETVARGRRRGARRPAPSSAWSSRSASSCRRRCSTALPARVRERALLAAAALARRGAGRAGDARRRPRDRRLHHGARSRARHRARVLARRAPIGAQETAGELRARLVAAGTELLVDTLPRDPDAPTPRAAVRASPPTPTSSPSTSSSSTGRCPRPSSPASCAPATRARARGPPTTARG